MWSINTKKNLNTNRKNVAVSNNEIYDKKGRSFKSRAEFAKLNCKIKILSYSSRLISVDGKNVKCSEKSSQERIYRKIRLLVENFTAVIITSEIFIFMVSIKMLHFKLGSFWSNNLTFGLIIWHTGKVNNW